MDLFGFNYVEENAKRKTINSKNMFSIRLKGGIREKIKFFSLTNPKIVRKFNILNRQIKGSTKIVSIENLHKKQKMYDIMTESENYFANGLLSHNCYVQAMAKRFPEMHEKYSGEKITLDEPELDVNYGKGKLIFIEHMNDLFAENVSEEIIIRILSHCSKYPDSKYVLQTKNPLRYVDFKDYIPKGTICGATIESNRWHEVMGKSPTPLSRMRGINHIGSAGFETFITIEPILDFDVDEFEYMIAIAHPSFVNIGADSKGHGLNEPSYANIMELYSRICKLGIEVRKKINLERLNVNCPK